MTDPADIPFHLRRRQQFMYEAFYEKNRLDQLDAIQTQRKYLSICQNEPKPDLSKIEVYQAYVYHEKFWLWMLDYTGGVDLDELAPRLSEVVDEYEAWHKVEIERRMERVKFYPNKGIEIDISPVDFNIQVDYQDTLQLLGAAILLRDERSVNRIIKLNDSNRSLDALFDAIAACCVEDDVYQAEELIHGQPYQRLLDCWYEETPEAKLPGLVKAYCENWYKAQSIGACRWYDGHKHIHNDIGPYYGYWAFEAGAVCYLLDIDDSSIDHMVYPKDLVAYAKKLYEAGRRTSTEDNQNSPKRLRALHGETVPETGIWYTPALKGEAGRRFFNVGDKLPETAYSDWGEVIWYFDQT